MSTTGLPSLVLGYHGTDESVAEDIFCGRVANIVESKNNHDWLGSGIYFWENSYERALGWAHERIGLRREGIIEVKKPAVIGAIINLGHCLDLLDQEAIIVVREVHKILAEEAAFSGVALPRNENPKKQANSSDRVFRKLDCAVINKIHTLNMKHETTLGYKPYDSVRSVFLEGDPVYKDAGFLEKTHIQICVRDPKQIIGYFRPRPDLSAITQSATPN